MIEALAALGAAYGALWLALSAWHWLEHAYRGRVKPQRRTRTSRAVLSSNEPPRSERTP